MYDCSFKGSPEDDDRTSAATMATSKDTTPYPFRQYASISHVGKVDFNPGKVNQDRFVEVHDFGGQRTRAFFGVYDGHGMNGEDVSSYLVAHLPKLVANHKKFKNTDMAALKQVLTEAHAQCSSQLTRSREVATDFAGSTAISCFIKDSTVLTANVGDSRAVMARQVNGKLTAVALSEDQKPDSPGERERIIAANGRVEPCRDNFGNFVGPARVWLRNQDLPGLAMSRSFGDDVAGSVGCISVPEITEMEITPDDRFIILGSDGVWEFITNQEAVDIVAKCASPEQACNAMLREATARWRAEEEVIDDITCTIVVL